CQQHGHGPQLTF
nr:immunoglobulin light chain junction region [Macaca mulatta]